MTHASEFLDYDALPSLIEGGYITRREHPTASLFIYNYTNRTQFDRFWTPETKACRGLILDAVGNVVARPFTKFFGLTEHESPSLPDVPIGEPFEAYEKCDGSLGVAYRNPSTGAIQIATRGAFASEQALWATAWWGENCAAISIPAGQTYLFEIIFPGNRIVVDYGDRAELVLLAVIDNATGKDLPLPDNWKGAVARRYDALTIDELLATADRSGNFEGYVIRFPSTGLRVKIKIDEYVRLHRLLTQCTTRTIWEVLAAGGDITPMLDRVPDEFYGWVREKERSLRAGYEAIEDGCRRLVEHMAVPGDRKATAERFKQTPYPAVLFKLLDGKDPSDLIWKLLRPEHERPFVTQHETAA